MVAVTAEWLGEKVSVHPSNIWKLICANAILDMWAFVPISEKGLLAFSKPEALINVTNFKFQKNLNLGGKIFLKFSPMFYIID